LFLLIKSETFKSRRKRAGATWTKNDSRTPLRRQKNGRFISAPKKRKQDREDDRLKTEGGKKEKGSPMVHVYARIPTGKQIGDQKKAVEKSRRSNDKTVEEEERAIFVITCEYEKEGKIVGEGSEERDEIKDRQ